MDFRNKRVVVMGLGLIGGGVGVVKWLIGQGSRVLVTDLRTKSELKFSLEKLKGLKVEYVLGRHRLADFKNTDLIIKNPAVSWNSKYLKVARSHKIPITTDITLFFQGCQVPIIGVTGTKGKSTTTFLLGQIFKKAGYRTFVAGNIGKSPLEFLSALSKQSKVVLELSVQQLEDLARIKQSSHIAIITNIFPDHLNRYQNIQSYIKAKKTIFKYQCPTDYVILNYDNKITRRLSKEAKGHQFYFSTKQSVKGAFVKKGDIIFAHQKPEAFRRARKQKVEQKICSIKELRVLGSYNLANILAAVTGAVLSGLPAKIIKSAIRDFKGVTDRLEFVCRAGGVKYYNDTTATIPEATIAALKSLKPKTYNLKPNIILIAGGADKGLKFKELVKEIKKKCKAVILLSGSATPKLKYQILNTRYKIQIEHAKSMKEAVEIAKEIARKGDIVLLSPACASFGMFKNEFDRGKQFRKFVKMLK